MTQNYGRGPLIVMVRGTRVALGRGEAAQIFVDRKHDERLSSSPVATRPLVVGERCR